MPAVIKVSKPKINHASLSSGSKKHSFSQQQFLILVLFMAVLLLLVGLANLFFRPKQKKDTSLQIVPSGSGEASPSGIYVDLSGAVIRPGLYHLPDGSRVNDLLTAAGGLSADADRTWFAKSINLAQKLSDGIKIFIPETSVRSTLSEQKENNVLGTDITSLVNINIADQTELETLPEIGPATAQKIIKYREQVGFFQTPEELKEVEGIGDKTYESISEFISLY